MGFRASERYIILCPIAAAANVFCVSYRVKGAELKIEMSVSGLQKPFVYFLHGSTLLICNHFFHWQFLQHVNLHITSECICSRHSWSTLTKTSKTSSYVDQVTSDNIGTYLSYKEVAAVLLVQSSIPLHRLGSLIAEVKNT